MALVQAGLAAHGHIWALDWAVASASASPGPTTSRMASSIDFALAAERDAMRDTIRWEIHNATLELRGTLLPRLDALRTQLSQSQKEQREILDALATQRTEIMDALSRLQRSSRRDSHQLRTEQIKILEQIKLRGSDREKEKKKSAIGEGLWGLLSSTVREDREKKEESTTTVITAATEAVADSVAESAADSAADSGTAGEKQASVAKPVVEATTVAKPSSDSRIASVGTAQQKEVVDSAVAANTSVLSANASAEDMNR